MQRWRKINKIWKNIYSHLLDQNTSWVKSVTASRRNLFLNILCCCQRVIWKYQVKPCKVFLRKGVLIQDIYNRWYLSSSLVEEERKGKRERDGKTERDTERQGRARLMKTTPDWIDTKTSPLSSFKLTETDVLIMIFVKLISSDFHLWEIVKWLCKFMHKIRSPYVLRGRDF